MIKDKKERKIVKGNGVEGGIVKQCFRVLDSLHCFSLLMKSLKSTFIFLVFTLAGVYNYPSFLSIMRSIILFIH